MLILEERELNSFEWFKSLIQTMFCDVISAFVQVTLPGAWKDIMEANADDTLKEWLTEYYDQLLSTWHAEVEKVSD